MIAWLFRITFKVPGWAADPFRDAPGLDRKHVGR